MSLLLAYQSWRLPDVVKKIKPVKGFIGSRKFCIYFGIIFKLKSINCLIGERHATTFANAGDGASIITILAMIVFSAHFISM